MRPAAPPIRRPAIHRPAARRRAPWAGGFVAALAVGAGVLVLGSAPAGGQQAVVHAWQRVFYAPLDGVESLLFAERFRRAKPALGDLNGDGRLDLLLGHEDGRLLFFENQGTPQAPRWRLVNPAISARRGTGPDEPALPIDVGENAAPVLVDLDGDGDLDLVVGSAAGKAIFFRNEGNRYLPGFRLVSDDFLGASVGLNVVVKFPDLNGDGLPDLSVGNEAGEVFIALNQGARGNPRYCMQAQAAPDCLHPLRKLLQLSPEDNAVPEWSDWSGNGALDLFVGKSDGTIAFYRNLGTPREGAWELAEARFNLLDSGSFAAPVFADVTGNGAADLLLAGDGESVAFYSRRPREPGFALWLEERNVLQVRRLGGHASQVRVATGDLTGNGLLDLVVGTRGGELLIYENVGSAAAPAFRSPREPLLPTPQRAFAAPALVDVTGNGLLDLIVGGRDGRLEWIENTGTRAAPRWTPRSLFFGQVDVGSLSAPLFADLNGDGRADLLVGSGRGQLAYYEQVGAAGRPEYALRTARLGGLQLPASAAPALFRWNPQGAPDLVVGGQAGTLIPAVRDPALPVVEGRAFLRERPWGGGLHGDSHSAPHFADLSGDGRPDLLLGTGSGAVLFWRYEGTLQPGHVAAAERPPGSNVVAQGPRGAAPPSLSGLSADAPPGAPGIPGSPPGEAPREEEPPLEPIFVYEPSPLERLRPGRAARPALFDANGNGRLDLLVGTAEGKLLLYESTGDRRSPTWRLVSERFAGYDGERYAAPALADVTGNGLPDLAVGNEQGRVLFWENTGTRTQPRFVPRHERFAAVRAGRNAVPAFADLDADGRLDLIVGNLRGELVYYVNRGGLRFELEIRRFLSLELGVNVAPTFADLVRRDVPSLVVGSDRGTMRIYSPTGTSRLRSSGWREQPAYVEGLRLPPGVHPALGDLDGDGDLDLVVGSAEGTLRLFRNQAIRPELAQAGGG